MLGRSDVRDLLDRHGIEARRSLGQNFVVDPNTVRSIAGLAGVGPDDHVVEIGPGLGSLTLALADTGAEVLAVEKDRNLLPVLDEVLAGERAERAERGAPALEVRVVEGDALTVEWADLLGPDADQEWVLVANLPYNVAVPVVLRALGAAPRLRRLVVMVQLEVAERLCAEPGSRTIGVPTVKVGWYGAARIVKRVGPEVFVPRPRVGSAVVAIDRRPPPSQLVGPLDVFPLVERAYRQRRKMLRSTLGEVVDPDVFAAAGVDQRDRPEQLGLGDWVRLVEAIGTSTGDGAR